MVNPGKVVVCCWPKCGSRSVAEAWRRKGADVVHTHDLRKLKELIEGGCVELVVHGERDPYDQLLSYYFQTVHGRPRIDEVRSARNGYTGYACPGSDVEPTVAMALKFARSPLMHEHWRAWHTEFAEIVSGSVPVHAYCFSALGHYAKTYGLTLPHLNDARDRPYFDMYCEAKRLLRKGAE